MSEIERNPRTHRETAFGIIYGRSQSSQVIATLVAIPGGIAILYFSLNYLLAPSEMGIVLIFIAAICIIGAGYSTWMGRLSALAFNKIGKGILLTLFNLLVHRKKPENLQDVLPSKEVLEEMAVAAQKAANSFVWTGFPIAAIFSLFIAGTTESTAWLGSFILVFIFLFAYACLLAWLGRRGFLLLPEE